jgi:hypothetical protein
MNIMEGIISGKNTSADQSKALTALRKEYYRRNIEINSMDKILTKIELVNQRLEEEVERLEDTML